MPFVKVPTSEVVAGYPPEEQEMVRQSLAGSEVFVNNAYRVVSRPTMTPLGQIFQLAVSRIDQEPCHDWRELQKVKNSLCGEEAEAVELYPAESRLVDANNCAYLYVLGPQRDQDNNPVKGPDGLWLQQRFPFGFTERYVREAPLPYSKQRPWPKNEKPADLTTLTPMEAFRQHLEALEAQKRASQPFQAVLALQEAPDPERALQDALGASRGLLEAVRGKDFVERTCNRILELVRYRKEASDPQEADSLGREAERLLNLFARAGKEAADVQPDPLGEGRHEGERAAPPGPGDAPERGDEAGERS